MKRLFNETPAKRSLYQQFFDETLRYVPASEMLGTLGNGRALGGPQLLRGVALTEQGGLRVQQALQSIGIEGLTDVGQRPGCDGPCSPVLTGNEGVVLSGMLRRLMVVGGTVDGQIGGQPHSSAWLLDVDLNAWTELPVADPLMRPGHVSGASYRAQDQRVYLVDLRNGNLRMSGYRPRGAFEPLAELPSAWRDFDQSWLAVGQGG